MDSSRSQHGSHRFNGGDDDASKRGSHDERATSMARYQQQWQSRRKDIGSLKQIRFEGTIYYIQGAEDDQWAWEEFGKEPTLGFACQWVPDNSPISQDQRPSYEDDGEAQYDNPIELIALSTLETDEKQATCIIWILDRFEYQIPSGLSNLMKSDKIVKVGCALKATFAKLEKAGVNIRPTPNQDWWAASGYIDIQNAYRLKQLGYDGKIHLEALCVSFLGTVPYKTPSQNALLHLNQVHLDKYDDLRAYVATLSSLPLQIHEEQQKAYYDIFQNENLETLTSYANSSQYTNTFTSLLYIEQTAQVEHLSTTTCRCKLERSSIQGRIVVRREELSSLENTPFFLLGESRYVSISEVDGHSPISTGFLEKIQSEDNVAT